MYGNYNKYVISHRINKGGMLLLELQPNDIIVRLRGVAMQPNDIIVRLRGVAMDWDSSWVQQLHYFLIMVYSKISRKSVVPDP